MYLEGTIHDFEQRLHQLPEGTGDLELFCLEATGYSGDSHFYLKIGKEFDKKEWIFGYTGYTGAL